MRSGSRSFALFLIIQSLLRCETLDAASASAAATMVVEAPIELRFSPSTDDPSQRMRGNVTAGPNQEIFLFLSDSNSSGSQTLRTNAAGHAEFRTAKTSPTTRSATIVYP